ncbi:ABC transporter transmembrane domain-containing protein [Nonomuraea ferruginea]
MTGCSWRSSRRLAERLGRVPIGWFSRRRTGELAKVVGDDVSAVHPFVAHAPSELVAAFVVPLVSLLYLFAVDWRLTLITLVPVVLAVALVPLMMTPARLRERRRSTRPWGASRTRWSSSCGASRWSRRSARASAPTGGS